MTVIVSAIGPARVLALDTSTTACSVAVLAEGRLAAHRFEAMVRGQAERLNPMIGEAMAAADLAFRSLDMVAVTTGPGAFTGLRIGIACARAVALACGARLAGITTFDALARAVPADERTDSRRDLIVCVDGKRRDVFAQRYDAALHPRGAPFVLVPAEAASVLAAGRFLLAGDGAPQVAAALAVRFAADGGYGTAPESRIRLSAAIRPPDAAHVAVLAAALAAAGADMEAPRPFYIRPPDVRLPGAREGG